MLERLLIGLLATALAAAAFVARSLDSPESVEPHLEGSFRLAGVQLIEPGIRRSTKFRIVPTRERKAPAEASPRAHGRVIVLVVKERV